MKIIAIISAIILLPVMVSADDLELEKHIQSAWEDFIPDIRERLQSFMRVKCNESGLDTSVKSSWTAAADKIESCIYSPWRDMATTTYLNPKSKSFPKYFSFSKAIVTMEDMSKEKFKLAHEIFGKPTCKFLSGYMKCFEPLFRYRHEQRYCHGYSGSEEAYEYSELLTRALCKEDGKLVIDFVEAGGMSCFLLIKDALSSCPGEVLLNQFPMYAIGSNSSKYCRGMKKKHECIDVAMNMCPEKPTAILHVALADARNWVYDNCPLHVGSAANLKCSSLFYIFVLLMSALNF